MAYENIDIKDGKEKIVIANGCKVEFITIDRDTGNFMFMYSVNKAKKVIELFKILINGVVVDLYFITHYEKETDTKVYTLEKYFINGDVDKETVLEEVRKAVEVYGYDGRTKEMKKTIYNNYLDDVKGRLDLSMIK